MKSYARVLVGVSFVSAGAFAGCAVPGRGEAGDGVPPRRVEAPAAGREVRSYTDRVGQTEYYAVEDDRGQGLRHSTLHPGTDANGVKLAGLVAPQSGWLGANDLQSAYGISTAYAGPYRPTIAIIDEEDDPNAEADLGVYRAQYGIPACTSADGCFQKLNEHGQGSPLPATAGQSSTLPDGGKGDTNAIEIALDIEVASATCPSCKILLIEATSTLSPFDAWTTAISLGATFISNSFAYFESDESAATWRGYESSLNQAGVSFFAGSGDLGYGVFWPSTSAYVTAVGGTILTQTSADTWTQTAWPFGGAGCSTAIYRPSWQTDTWCGNYRTVADVAAVAQNVAMYDSWESGGWISISGTSVATPVTAGIYATNGWGGKGPSYSYTAPSSFTDVTTGNDCDDAGPGAPVEQCHAGAGYDEPTGNGSAKGGAPDTFTANPSSISVMQNGFAYTDLVWGGSWVSYDDGNDATCTVTTNLPAGSGGASAYCMGDYPNLTLQVTPPLTTPLSSSAGPYSATVTATDAVSQISHILTVPIDVTPCVATTCPANACGTIASTNGCGGGPVVCGTCASGYTCSSNVCCPDGDHWDPVGNACVLTCATGTSICPATGTCLTTLACNNATGGDCHKVGKIIECY